MICPECKKEIGDNAFSCPSCGFDIITYKAAYEKILKEKRETEIESKSWTAFQSTSQIYDKNKIGIIVGVAFVAIAGIIIISNHKTKPEPVAYNHYNSYDVYEDYSLKQELRRKQEERDKLDDVSKALIIMVNDIETNSASTFAECTIKNTGNRTYIVSDKTIFA